MKKITMTILFSVCLAQAALSYENDNDEYSSDCVDREDLKDLMIKQLDNLVWQQNDIIEQQRGIIEAQDNYIHTLEEKALNDKCLSMPD